MIGDQHPFAVDEGDDDELFSEKSLRPRTLSEFIGQERVVENLRLAIDGAKARGEVLDHVLLSGMPGLGKTTLSYLIASELGVRLHPHLGPNLERGKDLVGILTGVERGDVVFIDEIHRMAPEAEEFLYSAMEDFRVDLMLDKGPDARSVRLELQPFTLIGATTREGLLTAPLLSRFEIPERLDLYSDDEIDLVIRRSAKLLGCPIEPEASRRLASRCRGTPRFANRFLRRIRDVAQARLDWKPGDELWIDVESVEEGLRRLGIDEHGLGRVDRRLLEILIQHDDQPVGLKTLAASVGEDERTIEDVYEPHLIRQGFVVKTARGRRATAKAYELFSRRSSQLELF
ncbi:MAG TPA: Holliday junction branch migration DNA helicase RuvB [Planctomycetota bacterium]|nr:Holliday junction branch migration DNA helicase RuvB [Planctomycetota bacterium]